MEGQNLGHHCHVTNSSEMKGGKDNASYKDSMLSLLFYVNDLLKLVLVVPYLYLVLVLREFMKTFFLTTVFAKFFVVHVIELVCVIS